MLATPLAFVGVPTDPRGRFALLGVLHAAAIWASLPRRPAVMRGVLFVLAAALTSAGVVELGMLSSSATRDLPVSVVLAACSAAGAIVYGWSVRRILAVHFAPGPLLATALACAVAVFAVTALISGSRVAPLPSIALAWWYAFSGGLCWADGIRWRHAD